MQKYLRYQKRIINFGHHLKSVRSGRSGRVRDALEVSGSLYPRTGPWAMSTILDSRTSSDRAARTTAHKQNTVKLRIMTATY